MKLNELTIKDITAKIPIIQGGMGIGVSGWKLASAVATAGGIGVISGAQIGYREKDFLKNTLEANIRAFKEEIYKAKENTKGIIGVNLMVAMKNYAELVKVAVEKKVDLIISGAGLPMNLPELVAGSQTKIVPIVSSLRAADIIIKRWKKKYKKDPDAIIVEGPEAGGHLGFKREELDNKSTQDLFTIVKELKSYLNQNKINAPVIAAGGIFNGKDIVKAVNSGASGVQMATRFVATDECDASDAYKQAYIDAKKEDVVIMQSPLGLPGRALINPMLNTINQGKRIPIKNCCNCVRKCDVNTVPFCITEALVNAVQGDLDNSLLFVGSRVFDVDKIQPVQDIFNELVHDVESL